MKEQREAGRLHHSAENEPLSNKATAAGTRAEFSSNCGKAIRSGSRIWESQKGVNNRATAQAKDASAVSRKAQAVVRSRTVKARAARMAAAGVAGNQ